MPLQAIKVVELAAFVFGPHAACHLGDMGAEVIKIEHPAGGDPSRGMAAIRSLPIAGLNYLFEQDNRNKKSVTLDLRQAAGREIAYKLVERADVFVSNFQVEVLQRLGMDYETLAKINPRLVYALGSGWGLRGPDKDLQAFDFVAFARCGLMATMGEPDCPPPTALPGMGDHIAATTLAFGIMVALFHRQATGQGQLVHTSLLGSLIEAGSLNLQACLSSGQDVPRVARTSAANPLWNYYQTKDGRWLQLAMLQTDRHWPDLCQALSLQKLEYDSRFSSHQSRVANNVALISILDQVFADRTLDEWAVNFRGRNVIWGYVSTYAQVAQDPQVRENNHIVEFEHPAAGLIELVGLPVELDKTPGEIRLAAPELGQHTEEVLLSLGYDWKAISELKESNVIL
ncbi:MAG: CoA transferase [Chloroflexi bacterium]|nr:CoA transferase [Chloroflexota bacterium]